MMALQQETTLAKVRFHWGIFIPVLLGALAPIVGILVPILFVYRILNTMAHAFPSIPSFNLIWLLALCPYLLIAAGLLLGTWFSYLKSEVTLTDRRLVFRTGFLSRRAGELPLENVESIYISESLLGRLCGYGTVTVTTIGGAHFPLSFIGSPQTFYATLQRVVVDKKNLLGRSPNPPEPRSPLQDDSRYKPKG